MFPQLLSHACIASFVAGPKEDVQKGLETKLSVLVVNFSTSIPKCNKLSSYMYRIVSIY
jgi:hypothetical protein